MTIRPAFASALVERGRLQAEEVAFSWEGRAITYGELLAAAERIAAALVVCGVAPGDRVALLVPAGPPFLRAFSAVTLAGAVPFALPAELKSDVALRRAARGRPALVLTSGARYDEVSRAAAAAGVRAAAIERLAELGAAAAGSGIEAPPVDPESPAFLQFTSGTTGEPRLAQLSHRALAAWRRHAEDWIEPRPGEVLAGWVPPWHIMGLLRYVYLPVVGGVVAHLIEPSARRLGDWLELAARVRATRSSAPDFALRTAVRLVGTKAIDLSSMRLLLTGGENVRRSTIRAFEERFHLPGVVRPGYGLAEATMTVTAVEPGEPLREDRSGNLSCGRPLSGVELRIVDEGGGEVCDGDSGEIWIRSGSLFSGYFGAAAGETHLTADGWLATGDWGRTGSDGELYVLGRRRNLLKHGGATWAPRELEEAADRVAGVVASAAIALRREGAPERGPIVVAELGDAVAVPAERPRGERLEEIARAVAESVRRELGIFPGDVLLVAAGTLPRTDSGKLRHVELRRRLAAGEIGRANLLFGPHDGWTE